MIGVIADDLTGAAELGAVGRRLGLKADILLNGHPTTNADLICLDTDSRSCTPAQAANRAAAAAGFLQAAGARWIYKKVDSVLRGNVTAEVEAVMRQLGLDRAVLLPANPSLGRIIRGGEYFVNGTPIDRTEFAHDPQYPRRSSQVLHMIDAPQHFELRLAGENFEVPEKTILIGQADSSEAVRTWARTRTSALLPVGGAEFFGALLAEERPPPTTLVGQDFEFGDERQLFICGTTSKAGEELFRSARQANMPVFTLPQELMRQYDFLPQAVDVITQQVITAFAGSKRVVLGVGLPHVQDARLAQRLTGHLVSVAELILRRCDIKYVFAEGGATSAELVRRMNWSRLEVCREWAPGVATLAVPSANPTWLTIKPGSYSWPKAWTAMT